MKVSFRVYIATVLTLLFCLSLTASYAQKKKPKSDEDHNTDCLKVTGNFDETMKSLEGTYTAKILRDNKVEQEQTLKVSKGFKFVLKKGILYTLKIEKPGYIARLVSIDTKIPDKTDIGDLFKFHFETNLIDEAFYHHFDDDDIDFPIALVAYSKGCDCFEFDKKYTKALMSRLVGKIMVGGY